MEKKIWKSLSIYSPNLTIFIFLFHFRYSIDVKNEKDLLFGSLIPHQLLLSTNLPHKRVLMIKMNENNNKENMNYIIL